MSENDGDSSQSTDLLGSEGFSSIVDKHLDAADELPDDEPLDDDPPESHDDDPEDDDPPPDDDDDDPDDDDYEDEDYDDDEEEEEEEDEEEEEEEEEDDPPEDDDEEEEKDFLDDKPLTRKQREEIEKNPILKKRHAQMQRYFTEATTEVKALERELRTREAEVERFTKGFQDAESFTGMMTGVMQKRPDIAAAAFEGVASSKDQEAFMLEYAINNPKTFTKVHEQLTDLLENPQALEQHKAATQARIKEAQLADRERQLNQRVTQRDKGRIEAKAAGIARNLRIQKADMKYVLADLEKAFSPHISKQDGSIEFADADIRASVRATKKHLDRVYNEIADRERKRTTRKSQRSAKTKARTKRARRGRGPRQRAGRRATSRRAPRKAPRGRDVTQADRDEFLTSMLSRSIRQQSGLRR